MAMPVQPITLGVDVSKAEVAVARSDRDGVELISNNTPALRAYLKRLPAPARLAVEATNTYHLVLIELAHALGHAVYVVDGYRLSNYRKGIGGRAKTDASDARLLRRYLEHEHTELRPWSPPPKGYRTIQVLLQRRATLVKARVSIEQSLHGITGLAAARRAMTRQLRRLDALLERRLTEALRAHGWLAHTRRCQAIEGIGPLTAAALTHAFHRGAFQSSDAFIAFLGLDVRARDSGQLKGRRKLTKQGHSETRRLLYLAAMAASRSTSWQPFYQRYIQRGFSRIQALVIVARKLARVAFALLRDNAHYQPKTHNEACMAT